MLAIMSTRAFVVCLIGTGLLLLIAFTAIIHTF